MNFLKKPFFLGKAKLPNNIFYSPLAGCSDFPFRQMTSRYQPGIIYCEMVKMEALIRNDPNTFRLLDYDKSMHPIGGQLVGSNPKIAGQAAKMIEELGFDSVDLNCGCPVDKVTKDGSGSGLLRTPELIGEILMEMVAAVEIPVTVKIRAGWDESSINAPLVTQIAEQAGAKAITIHGRTRKQGYSGPANWDWIRECVEVADKIKVVGNGDVTSGEAALKMFETTGCDAVLVSRGTMGQPWIVQDIIDFLSGKEVKERTLEEAREALLDHYRLVLDYQRLRKATVDARRIGCWYLKKAPGTKSFRQQISCVESPEQALDLIR
ncbi:MAG: putative tRNA-dihydrouridine synthase, partial [Chlamydiae bacterium]|nr:putative tRNA-dihydrouridine synthase [Chlamydiota bacterium]